MLRIFAPVFCRRLFYSSFPSTPPTCLLSSALIPKSCENPQCFPINLRQKRWLFPFEKTFLLEGGGIGGGIFQRNFHSPSSLVDYQLQEKDHQVMIFLSTLEDRSSDFLKLKIDALTQLVRLSTRKGTRHLLFQQQILKTLFRLLNAFPEHHQIQRLIAQIFLHLSFEENRRSSMACKEALSHIVRLFKSATHPDFEGGFETQDVLIDLLWNLCLDHKIKMLFCSEAKTLSPILSYLQSERLAIDRSDSFIQRFLGFLIAISAENPRADVLEGIFFSAPKPLLSTLLNHMFSNESQTTVMTTATQQKQPVTLESLLHLLLNISSHHILLEKLVRSTALTSRLFPLIERHLSQEHIVEKTFELLQLLFSFNSKVEEREASAGLFFQITLDPNVRQTVESKPLLPLIESSIRLFPKSAVVIQSAVSLFEFLISVNPSLTQYHRALLPTSKPSAESMDSPNLEWLGFLFSCLLQYVENEWIIESSVNLIYLALIPQGRQKSSTQLLPYFPHILMIATKYPSNQTIQRKLSDFLLICLSTNFDECVTGKGQSPRKKVQSSTTISRICQFLQINLSQVPEREELWETTINIASILVKSGHSSSLLSAFDLRRKSLNTKLSQQSKPLSTLLMDLSRSQNRDIALHSLFLITKLLTTSPEFSTSFVQMGGPLHLSQLLQSTRVIEPHSINLICSSIQNLCGADRTSQHQLLSFGLLQKLLEILTTHQATSQVQLFPVIYSTIKSLIQNDPSSSSPSSSTTSTTPLFHLPTLFAEIPIPKRDVGQMNVGFAVLHNLLSESDIGPSIALHHSFLGKYMVVQLVLSLWSFSISSSLSTLTWIALILAKLAILAPECLDSGLTSISTSRQEIAAKVQQISSQPFPVLSGSNESALIQPLIDFLDNPSTSR